MICITHISTYPVTGYPHSNSTSHNTPYKLQPDNGALYVLDWMISVCRAMNNNISVKILLSDAAQQLTAALHPHHHQKQLDDTRQLQRPLQIQRELSVQAARSVPPEPDRAIEGEGASILHAGDVRVAVCRQMQQLH